MSVRDNKCVAVFVNANDERNTSFAEDKVINTNICNVTVYAKEKLRITLSSLFSPEHQETVSHISKQEQEQTLENVKEHESMCTSNMHHEIFALTDTLSLHRAIRHVRAHLNDKYYGVINLCTNTYRFPDNNNDSDNVMNYYFSNSTKNFDCENDGVSNKEEPEIKEKGLEKMKRYNNALDKLSTIHVALLLEKSNVRYSGCRANTLSYPLDVMFMMIAYANIPLPRYRIISTSHDVKTTVTTLKFPLQVRNITPVIENYRTVISDAPTEAGIEESVRRLHSILDEHGPLMVWEYVRSNASQDFVVDVLVMASSANDYTSNNNNGITTTNNNNNKSNSHDINNSRHSVKAMSFTDNVRESSKEPLIWLSPCTNHNNSNNHSDDNNNNNNNNNNISLSKCDEDKLRSLARCFANDVLRHAGYALLQFRKCNNAEKQTNTDSSNADTQQTEWCLIDFELNCNLFDLPTHIASQVAYEQLGAQLMRSVQITEFTSPFAVRLHDDSRKGYHLCATRNIASGELIFCDEGRSFAIVTRPHVDKYWSDSLKETFSEYAWPLDSEGHLYAIWESDPTRWRPINHSCDPNCMFAAPHSLNVIAARYIYANEDLTMDYATFCDSTMKPFTCFCNSPLCRGYIKADETVLQQYGGHAWRHARTIT